MRVRRRVHEILTSQADDSAANLVDGVLVALIFANIAAFVAGSHREIEERFGAALGIFEAISVLVFSVEYVLRMWSCVEAADASSPWRQRFRQALRPLMIVDLLAILPFYLPLVAADLRPLRVLRVLRLLRVLKLGRYSSALQLLQRVLVRCKYELIATFSIVALLEVLAACLMWLAEREAQPEAFSSVTAAAWWAIVTLTTVGYGDIAPVTPAGKLLGGVVALLGVLVIALPAAILGSAMLEILRESAPTILCPSCGTPVHGPRHSQPANRP
jgi:voltage-gated potassium channel